MSEPKFKVGDIVKLNDGAGKVMSVIRGGDNLYYNIKHSRGKLFIYRESECHKTDNVFADSADIKEQYDAQVKNEVPDEEVPEELEPKVEQLKKPLDDTMVNHPPHYTAGKVECIDALESATVNLTGIEAVCTANAIKYLWRWKQKNGVEDLRKAQWYISRLIAVCEEQTNND